MSANASPQEAATRIVVVAHPDDEALWLSSVLGSADRIVFCFGDVFAKPRRSEARRRAVAALPLSPIVDLAIPECGAGSFPPGSALNVDTPGIRAEDQATRARYEANGRALMRALQAPLGGAADVYTHNPWGEYGHAEHIQLFRALRALQEELGYTLWFSNYVGRKSWPLARELGKNVRWSDRRVCRPDVTTAKRLMRVYRAAGAWTWTPAHRWPESETLYALAPRAGKGATHPLAGESLQDVAGLRWWPPPWWPHERRLPQR